MSGPNEKTPPQQQAAANVAEPEVTNATTEESAFTWAEAKSFAAENYQLMFFVPWIFGMIALTEFLKPWIRELLKPRKRADLVTGSVPYVAGTLTGIFLAPEVGLAASPLWGAATGGCVGWVATLAYERYKDGTMGRWTTFFAFSLIDAIPFITLSEENKKYLQKRDPTVKRDPTEIQDLQATLDQLKKHGTILIDDNRIVLRLDKLDEESEVEVEPPQ